jgi:hypothetical protein
MASDAVDAPVDAAAAVMRRTRVNASEADFQFIMTDILCQKADSPLFRALERSGIEDVGGIATLDNRAISQRKYRDNSSGNGAITKELPLGFQQLLRAFNAFVRTKFDEGAPVHGDLQNLCIEEDFQEFRLSGFDAYSTSLQLRPRHPRWQHPGVILVAAHRTLPWHAILLPNSRRVSNVTQHPLLS